MVPKWYTGPLPEKGRNRTKRGVILFSELDLPRISVKERREDQRTQRYGVDCEGITLLYNRSRRGCGREGPLDVRVGVVFSSKCFVHEFPSRKKVRERNVREPSVATLFLTLHPSFREIIVII